MEGMEERTKERMNEKDGTNKAMKAPCGFDFVCVFTCQEVKSVCEWSRSYEE